MATPPAGGGRHLQSAAVVDAEIVAVFVVAFELGKKLAESRLTDDHQKLFYGVIGLLGAGLVAVSQLIPNDHATVAGVAIAVAAIIALIQSAPKL